MREIDLFHDAITDVATTASHIKKRKKKILGYLCSYAPEEIMHAAGFHPMRLFSSKSDIVLAENHLQGYCCSLVRGVLEDSLAGRLSFLDGTVFPHTCDSIQRLSDIFRMNNRYEFFADVVLPAKLTTQSAGIYMVDVLRKFKKDLETAIGREISNAALETSIKTFNLIRENLSDLYAVKSQSPEKITGTDLYAIVKGSMIMDRDQVADLLPVIVSHLKQTTAPVKKAKRLVLSGSVCDSPDILAAIEAAGGVIVGDDLCTGQRWFETRVMEDKDPITAIAKRYLLRMPCPAKHAGLTVRGENLVSLARKNNADGVIFMLQKFCDPHAFDFPYLKAFLDKGNIKTLVLEMDDQQQTTGQLSTRIETFVHMI